MIRSLKLMMISPHLMIRFNNQILMITIKWVNDQIIKWVNDQLLSLIFRSLYLFQRDVFKFGSISQYVLPRRETIRDGQSKLEVPRL